MAVNVYVEWAWNGHGVRSINCLELEMKSETIRCTLILTGGYVCE